MNKTVGIAVIHGIGSQSEAQFNETVTALSSRVNQQVDALGGNSSLIAWQPIYWAYEIEKRQRTFLQDASQENRLDYLWLRRFVVSTLGDASAYLPVKGRTNIDKTYDTIHALVRHKISQLYRKLGHREQPLIILAHSLGSVIISNHVWDIQQGLSHGGDSNFENMSTLTGLFTFGSTLPLFTFAYDPVRPIAFPPPELSLARQQQARWVNFYDVDDVLGYPLKQISPAYANLSQLEDREIRVGGLLTGWNPFSHFDYWTDNRFTRPVAEFVTGVLAIEEV